MKIGISNFAKKRHKKGTGHSYFKGTEKKLINCIKESWENRLPGHGESGLLRKVVVPINSIYNNLFVFNIRLLEPNMKLISKVTRRQENEDYYIQTHLKKNFFSFLKSIFYNPIPSFVKVVLYSKEALLENDGEISGDYDWEVVAILCSDVENEPMHPLTMARNFLEKPGGTFSSYSAKEFAESIYYWSQRVRG